MKLKLAIASALIALCWGVTAHAKCMQETFGTTICGAGPCINGRDGRVFCAVERYGTADLDEQGGMKWWAHQDLNLGPIDYEDPGDPAPVTLR